MQAIITKYLFPTNTRGARIKAECERGSITVSYHDELSEGEDVHRHAVNALIVRVVKEDAHRYGSDPKRNPWARPLACGQIPDGRYVFVFTGDAK